ncbi:MAG: hypothetical protein JW838_05660 [Spirochaetes bacterium]|nr:hypothetical protein [Spirochaetota bacterium]
MNLRKKSENTPVPGAKTFVKKLVASGALRFAGWWSIFAGALALYSVCPVCGTVGCPVGIGVTGVLAGLLAALKQWGGRLISAVARILRPSRHRHVERHVDPGVDTSGTPHGQQCACGCHQIEGNAHG